MKYLIFSELQRNHFLFLSYLIISIIKNFNNRYRISGDDIIFEFNRYNIFILSDFLSIIPVIIIKVRSKGNSEKYQEDFKDNSSKTSNDIKYIYTDVNKKKRKRIFKLLILVSFFEFLGKYINIIFDIITLTTNFIIKKVIINSNVLFNIISKYALSILILHLPIYKHHYLSLGINLICLIGLVIYDIINIKEARSYIYVLMKIIVVILYSVEDVYAKILLSFESISTYIYLLYRGIFTTIFTIMYSIVFIFVKIPDEKGIKSCVFSRIWKVYENKLNILFCILSFFLEYISMVNVYLIIEKFSPIHYAIATILDNFVSLLISLIYGQVKVGEFFIKLLIFLILILAALIYNEFVVLNFCGFQKYTHLFLLREADKDLELTLYKNINENELFPGNENINKKDRINTKNRESSITEIRESNITEIRESNINEIRESNINEIRESNLNG